MNTSIKVGAALLLAGILIATTLPRKAGAQGAQQGQHQPSIPQTVILEGAEHWTNGLPVGFIVDISSSSPGAPVFQRGDNMAEALTILRASGFTVTVHAYGFLVYTAMR